jgi:hypothetical protein
MSEIRKLVAILVSDVVGYSRLTGADEDRILARLRALRSDLIDPTIAVHHGRVVKRTGDGAIVEFRSVVDAVNSAVEKRVSGAPDISVDEWLASVAQQTTIESSRKFVNLMKDFGASARTARGSICFDFEIGDKRLALFYLRGSGKAALSLYNLAKLAPFADENQRRALCDDLMSQGLKLSTAPLNGEPTFQLPAIEDAKEWEALRAILSAQDAGAPPQGDGGLGRVPGGRERRQRDHVQGNAARADAKRFDLKTVSWRAPAPRPCGPTLVVKHGPYSTRP